MNSIDTKLIEKYKEELQDLQLGYSFNRKNINYMLELVYLSMFVDSEYATDEEIFKYLKANTFNLPLKPLFLIHDVGSSFCFYIVYSL